MTKKKCTKCGELKELSEYWKQKNTRDGFRTWCKNCLKKDNVKNRKKWYAKNGKEYYENYEYDRKPHYKKYRESENGKKYIQAYYKTDYYKRINRCHGVLNWKFKSGKLKKRNTCEICYNSPTECHHEDYDKPLEYIELCKRCHEKLHAQYKSQGIRII